MTAAKPGTPTQGCLATYVADPNRHDELLDPSGSVREHWRPLIDSITEDDPTGTARRALELTRRLVVENGVTYNVYADPKGADRPWALDPLPLVMTGEDWRTIETGIAQRARVLNALLEDLYGPQKLIAEGLVPSELAFGHPNFLWPCHGVVPTRGHWLTLYAVDLARAPDGRWWVMADRTQTPSGAGYALENREIVERVLPEAIREARARRIDSFFADVRDAMLVRADRGEGPLAVILTPGPFNETYFEHAYLARQLGLVLAEGSDLTVRDDTVYLKTLAGLQRVHTILRRLDDDYCDPLELRGDSALGVAGLLGAVRARRVVLANALGTGVLESAAWIGFLPKIAERLLGEPLILPAVATWWCGEAPALEYVLANIEGLVIKPTYPNQRFEPVFGDSLTKAERDSLIERLRARPYAYVAQEHVGLSQVPVWRTDGASGLLAKAVSIRGYAVANQAGWQVMPGGLARVATDTAVDVVSTQRGGGSKDIWVVEEGSAVDTAEGAAAATQVAALVPRDAPADTARADSAAALTPPVAGARRDHSPGRHDHIPSRLVENLYWFGRYLVRCEDKALLLRATLAARQDAAVWASSVAFCRESGLLAIDPARNLRNDRAPQAVMPDVRRLSWCANQVRARLSAGYWRAVAQMQSQLQDALQAREEPRAVLDRLLLSLTALAGFALDDMTQDAGWRLLQVGRRIERIQFVCGLLVNHLSSDVATRQRHIEWLLDAYDSTRVYRARYVAAPRLGQMLDLLVNDPEHPRSLAFLSRTVAQELGAMAQSLGTTIEDALTVDVPALTDDLLRELEDQSDIASRLALAECLRALSTAAGELSERLSLRHFSHITFDSQAFAT